MANEDTSYYTQLMNFLGNESNNRALGTIGSGLGGLAAIYTGLRGLGMAKDQFNLKKDLMQSNFANQAQVANNQMHLSAYNRALGRGMSTADATNSANTYLQLNGLSKTLGG